MILAVCQLELIFSAALHKIATEFQTYIVVIIDGLTVCKCRNGLLRHCMLARFCDAASAELGYASVQRCSGKGRYQTELVRSHRPKHVSSYVRILHT